MVRLLALVLAGVAIVWAFFSPVWAWSPLAFMAGCLLLVLASVKGRLPKNIDGLSPAASEVFRKFGHYYAYPFGCQDFSGAASICQFAAIVLGVVGCFRGTFWSLGVAFVVYFVFGPLASEFYPIPLLLRYRKAEHDEIVEWVKAKSNVAQHEATS
jgi:hypothetical protein